MAAGAGELGEQLPKRGALLSDEPDDHLGAAAGSLHAARVGEIGRRQFPIELEMREVVSAKSKGKSVAADLGIRELPVNFRRPMAPFERPTGEVQSYSERNSACMFMRASPPRRQRLGGLRARARLLDT